MGRSKFDARIGALSSDARWFASSMMGMMVPHQSTLKFGMRESVPSPRTQAALDELVTAGLVSRHASGDGSVVYMPLVAFPTTARIPGGVGKWPITVPVSGGEPT